MRDEEFFLRRYSRGETPMADFFFYEMPAEALAEALYQRQCEVQIMREESVEVVTKRTVQGSLAEKLASLLPLGNDCRKELITGTRSGWAAYFKDRYGVGAGDSTQPGYMCQILQTRMLRVGFTKDIPNDQPGGAYFSVYDWRGGEEKVRYVYAHKESRWEFREYGERFPFEETENYSAKKIRDRLTLPMMERYCRHFGIELLDPDFYVGEGYLVQNPRPIWDYGGGRTEKIQHRWPQG